MSTSPTDRDRADGFSIEPRDRFFEANRAVVDHEMRPGRTSSFLTEVDLSEIDRLRTESWGGKISYTAFVVKAVALALRDHPYANRRVCREGFWPFGGPRLQAFTSRDIAVAVDPETPGAEGTAFFDVLRAADETPLHQIATELQALSKADVNANKQWGEFSGLIARYPSWLSSLLIRLSLASPKPWVEHRGGAVLVSSPARYGIDVILGTWSHPVGISFGLAKPRPVVVGGMIVVRPTFFLTLNFDRRVMGEAQAARFCKRVVSILEKPTHEMEDFRIEGGYFDVAGQAERIEPKKEGPAHDVTNLPSKRPEGEYPAEAPPTRIDMPVYTFPKSVKDLAPPETRDDMPTVDE